MSKPIVGGILAIVIIVGITAAAAYTSHSASLLDGVVYWPSYHDRQNVLRESLKDPESAKFRKLYFSKIGGVQYLCGEVNARNGMGGYNGYRPFYAGPAYAIMADDTTYTLSEILSKCLGGEQ
ncbi:MAG: hypothetical protein ACREPQ_18110 [Rhodanobacter sp.]